MNPRDTVNHALTQLRNHASALKEVCRQLMAEHPPGRCECEACRRSSNWRQILTVDVPGLFWIFDVIESITDSAIIPDPDADRWELAAHPDDCLIVGAEFE